MARDQSLVGQDLENPRRITRPQIGTREPTPRLYLNRGDIGIGMSIETDCPIRRLAASFADGFLTEHSSTCWPGASSVQTPSGPFTNHYLFPFIAAWVGTLAPECRA
jgi:hypothetical protein